jgi:GH25 family lysozyme M1 (1,4-beta-N-acetylmuramidase)
MTDTWSEDAGVLESPFPGRAAPAGEDLDERWFRGGVVESPFVAAPARAGQAQLSLEAELPQPAATLPRPDGIDVYSGNALPAAGAIRRAGISFVIHKSSERTKGGPLIPDPKFGDRWAQSRADGFIRGSYHYYRHCDGASGEQQADLVVAQVQRLGPGDLAPSLDLENASVVTGSAKPSPAAWREELESFLDTLEMKLGRTPLVYTGGSAWASNIKASAARPEFAHFGGYPLWQKSYAGPRFVGAVDLDNPPHPPTPAFIQAAANRAETHYRNRQSSQPYPRQLAPWQDWTFFQYSPYTPTTFLKNPFELTVDFDSYNGTIYGLRGLADLGRVGVTSSALGAVVAHSEVDQHIHLLRGGASGTWTDVDLMAGALPGLGGDPLLLGTGAGVILYFRSDDKVVEAAPAVSGSAWDVTDLSGIAGVRAWHDPCAIQAEGRRFVLFAGQDNDWHLLTRAPSGEWAVSHLLSEARRSGASVPASSGQPALYVTTGSPTPRVVGRLGPRGELYELAMGAQGWEATNLTGVVTGPEGRPPAATYSPAVCQSAAETFIVYRAVRGHLWQIARGARRATNLSAAAAGSVLAAGHPTCFLLRGETHVLYRGPDQAIYDLSFRDGMWSARRLPCSAPAASDPTCTTDGSTALVAFRGTDGMVRTLRFDGSTWICADTVRSQPAAAGTRIEELPGTPPGSAQAAPGAPSIFASLGAAASRFRELLATGNEALAVSMAYQGGEHSVDRLSNLVFFGRHPELGGRRIRPDEDRLSREWLSIRDGLVRPAVDALAHAAAQGRRANVEQSEDMSSGEAPVGAAGLLQPMVQGEATATIERGLEFITKWGRNASPFKIAHLYLKLNWDGLKYWNQVRKAAAKGHALLDRIDVLERGARVLKKAVDELSSAEASMPSFPLEPDDVAGHVMVTHAELEYVKRYFDAAVVIQTDTMGARMELDQAIAGWDAVLEQANDTSDFTRQAAWEAITLLNLRFSNQGGDFRAFLVNARDVAARTEAWASWKRYTAADILGK